MVEPSRMVSFAAIVITVKIVDRESEIMARTNSLVNQLVDRAGLVYPAKQLFFRVYKRERELQVWGVDLATGRLKLIKSYPVLAASGGPGPKRKEGDNQVPEGLYHIDRFNPNSLFHLSLGLNYPNASDRILSDREHPGSDIFIHGNSKSIGCLAIGDPAIEEVYTLARAAKNRVYVLILPARANPDPRDEFWKQIYAINNQFEKIHALPKVGIDKAGNYHVRG